MDYEITEVSGPDEEDLYTIRYRTSDGESNRLLVSSIEPRTPDEIVQKTLERTAKINAYIEYRRRPDVPIPPHFPSFKRAWVKQLQMMDMTEEEAKEAYTELCERYGYILDENMVPHKPTPAQPPAMSPRRAEQMEQ